MTITITHDSVNEDIKDNIQEHPLLDGFTFNKIPEGDKYSTNDVEVISNKGQKIESLKAVLASSPDELNEEYKKGNISSQEVQEGLNLFEQKQADLNNRFEELGFEWIKGIYNSMHGGHSINMLALKSLNLDRETEYYTNNSLSFQQEKITHLGNYGNKSLFITMGRKFGDMSMRGFSDGVYILALDKENNISVAIISGGSIMTSPGKFDLHNYEGHLLLSQARKGFMSNSQTNSLKILVNPDGELSQELFEKLEVNISETANGVERIRKKSMGILDT